MTPDAAERRARAMLAAPYVPCCDDRECAERQAERDVHDLARDVLALADALRAAVARAVAAGASATRSADAAVDAARELGHVASAAVAERDAAVIAHAALAAAVVDGRVAADADNAAAFVAAEARIDALLRGAPAGVVGAGVVRRHIGVVLAANGCDCECGHGGDEHDDDCDRCLACRVETALEAAIAAATTPKESP